MMSIRIEPDELEDIFELRYRGKNVRNIEAGDGVGMYMVKKSLDLLKAVMLVEPNYKVEKKDMQSNRYTLNKFTIKFS